MTQFTAVVTTGIYCRPGCGAKPLRANTRTFGSAAAAEASGYRACFQCRPYRSPQSVGWDAPELVCRAVRLILAGALDQGTEAELGARLGLSGRHLRRLFRAHVGATPDQLAVSQRTHFARRLLDDTDFTIAEIAFMAGFGSVRQLNRQCKQVFRDTPTALRARRRVSDRLTADGGIPLRLPIDGPFEWDAVLSYLDRTAIPAVENVEGGVYRRTILVENEPGVIEVEWTGDNHLVLTAHTSSLGRTDPPGSRRAAHLQSRCRSRGSRVPARKRCVDRRTGERPSGSARPRNVVSPRNGS